MARRYRDSQKPISSWEVASFKHSYTGTSSIPHWQLRNLLKPAGELVPLEDQEQSVLFINERKICLITMKKEDAKPIEIVTVDFLPYCFDSQYGYLAVGGESGFLAVYKVQLFELKLIWKGVIGRSPINSVELYNKNNSILLIVSINDGTVKILSVPSMSIYLNGMFPVPINHAVLNDKGDMLVAVGDSLDVYVYGVENDKIQEYAIFTEAEDHSYCCSWHPDNRTIAVGSQDGSLNIWDLRYASRSTKSGQTLAQFRAYQKSTSVNPIRSVKFTKSGSMDLLAFAEQSSYVSIVDTRTYENRQILHIREKNRLAHTDIAGISFPSTSESLYISTPNSFLQFGVDVASRRSFASYNYR